MLEQIKKLFYKFEAFGLDKNIRRESSKAREIIDALGLKPGDVVADIGSGSGFFVFEFAKAVGPEGRVYAIDTNQYLLDLIGAKARSQGLGNIIAVMAHFLPDLPKGEIDLVFNRATYHHLTDQTNYFKTLRACLAEQGRVAVIDYDRRKVPLLKKLSSHQTPKEKIVNDMTAAGYQLVFDLDFLPEQNFLMFQRI